MTGLPCFYRKCLVFKHFSVPNIEHVYVKDIYI